jgi:PhzF family phenazine biosynthesis protein
MKLDFKQVDVFTDRPFRGNPVAVVLGADALDGAQMQAIANWTNLSETTFVLRPTRAAADYRLRIFTPRSELPFAGHPTLGSAHAVLEAGIAAGRNGRLVQECGAGLVDIAIEGAGRDRRLMLTLPAGKTRALDEADIVDLEAALGTALDRAPAPVAIDVGPVWITLRLADAAAVLALKPDMGRLAALETRLGVTGVTLFGAGGAGAAIEVRSFAPSVGVPEDPVCGSGNGAVALFLRDNGLLEQTGRSYIAAQGRCLGRDGQVSVRVAESGAVQLGGACVTCIDGTLTA